jgi:hypothetical protein
LFTQFSGRRLCTPKDSNVQRPTQAFPNLGGSL